MATPSQSSESNGESQRFQQARKERNLTLEQLAERVGYSVGTLSGVENGHDRPSKRLRTRLIEVLAISPHWLKTGKGILSQSVASALDLQTIDERLFRLRFHCRQRWTEVANRLGYSESTLRSIREGRRRPGGDFLFRLRELERELGLAESPSESSSLVEQGVRITRFADRIEISIPLSPPKRKT